MSAKPGTKPGSGDRQLQIIKVLAVAPATVGEIERVLGTRGQAVQVALNRLRHSGIIIRGESAVPHRTGKGRPPAKWILKVQPVAAVARVESEKATVALVPDRERVDWHLDNWAGWMHARDNKQDYPHKSAGLMGMGGESVDTFDIMCDAEDTKCAQVVDAIIDDLVAHERMALEHVHLASVFSFKRLDMETVYLTARRHVAFALRSRGIY